MVKNLPFTAGDVDLIPGQRTKIPHVSGQPCLHAATREPVCHKLQSPGTATPEPTCSRAHVLQKEKQLQGETRAPQLESSPHLPNRESPHRSIKEPAQQKKEKKIFFLKGT